MTPSPRTAAGRALLRDLEPLGDATTLRDAILAIEAEAISVGHKEGYLSRAEDERFRVDFPEAAPAGWLRAVADIVKRHTHQGMWAMTRFAGEAPEEDCLLCRSLVSAGVLTLDQIGAGSRAALASSLPASPSAAPLDEPGVGT